MIISIIIVNWNTGELLRQCLESIAASCAPLPYAQLELFVVDNASTDGSQRAATAPYPFTVTLIENDRNVGFAQANNQAIDRACGQFILLLNPDTEVRPGALATLVRFLEQYPTAGAVGPRLLNGDGSLQTSCYPAPTLSGELFRLFHLDAFVPHGSYHMETWNQDAPREVEALLGACLLVRREVLDQVGLLDKEYFMYSEEIDLCYRIRRGGWTIHWVPQAEVVHYGGQSTRLVAAEMFLQLYRGKLLYFRKNSGRASAAAYKLLLGFASATRLLITPLALLQQPEQRRLNIALARRYGELLQRLPKM
ncbi:MAG TPA: glycosyltransferase family 2 protein [Candidatus Sulfomarinibacteraceae bacterium]|nr:glycosyltransferase family 2 protein [Candidatus Sulfomarinibacteraceae bacterium]